MVRLSLNATLWLWKSSNLRRALCGALWKELIQSLGVDSTLFGQAANRWRIAFLIENLAHEVDDCPVLRRKFGNALIGSDFPGEVFIPIVAMGKMTICIQLNRLSSYAHCSHMSPS